MPKRSAFLDWNRSAEIYAFNKRLSEEFNIEKLEQAFTHRSYIVQEEQRQREIGIEDPKLDIIDNTDLIMKGDKLVSEIVQSYLTQSLPQAPGDVIMYVHLTLAFIYLIDFIISSKLYFLLTEDLLYKERIRLHIYYYYYIF